MVSTPNSTAASSIGFGPAWRIAPTWVRKPSAAIAIANSTVSICTIAVFHDAGNNCSELKPLTTTNHSANHGTTIFDFAAPGAAPIRDDSSNRNGANSITRSIFSITAAEAADSPTARPAATTWATSWMVEPAYTP